MQLAFTSAHCCIIMQASDMARKALESEDLGEDEMQPAPKLLEVILQNCRGRVDQYLPLYMQASLTQPSNDNTPVESYMTALQHPVDLTLTCQQQYCAATGP